MGQRFSFPRSGLIWNEEVKSCCGQGGRVENEKSPPCALDIDVSIAQDEDNIVKLSILSETLGFLQ